MALTMLSFLGTSRYESVQYSLDGKVTKATPYIQAGLAELYHEELCSVDSSIRIFMTDEARQRHWDPEGSLQSELHVLLPQVSIEPVMIPQLKNEAELWKVFNVVYGVIPEQSEILLDITHGYRSIPLLGSVVLDYSRSLKRIKIRAIHYGAIEARQDGIVPIINLSKLDRLFRWNRSVELFVRHGDASGLDGLVGETKRYATMVERNGHVLQTQSRLTATLRQSYELLATVRGADILDGGPFIAAQQALKDLAEEDGGVSPLVPIYDLVRSRISGFHQGDSANLLYAIALCIDYGLIQQGITLLQESIITILLLLNNLDENGRNQRDAVSRYFAYLSRTSEKYTDPEEEEKFQSTVSILKKDTLCIPLAEAFNAVRDLRNNINHAGFTATPPRPERFRQTLKLQFKATIAALVQVEEFHEACIILSKKLSM